MDTGVGYILDALGWTGGDERKRGITDPDPVEELGVDVVETSDDLGVELSHLKN